MGRYRTITKNVDIEVCDLMDELEDDELIEELKRRKCDMRFIDFSFPELDDSQFQERMIEMIYKINTDRTQMIFDAIKESYHYPFLKEPQ